MGDYLLKILNSLKSIQSLKIQIIPVFISFFSALLGHFLQKAVSSRKIFFLVIGKATRVSFKVLFGGAEKWGDLYDLLSKLREREIGQNSKLTKYLDPPNLSCCFECFRKYATVLWTDKIYEMFQKKNF